MSDELLPCPFCGGSASIERLGTPRQSTIYACDDCGCRLETGEEWGHGDRWNTRTPPPTSCEGTLAPREVEGESSREELEAAETLQSLSGRVVEVDGLNVTLSICNDKLLARVAELERERDELKAQVRVAYGFDRDAVFANIDALTERAQTAEALAAELAGALEVFARCLPVIDDPDERWEDGQLQMLETREGETARLTIGDFRKASASLARWGERKNRGSSTTELPAHVADATATEAQNPAGGGE